MGGKTLVWIDAILLKLYNFGDNALFMIKEQAVHCFIPDYSDYKFDKEWEKNQGRDLIKKRYKIALSLDPQNIKLIGRAERINQLKGFNYSLEGRIIRKERFDCVIDCGLPVRIGLPNNLTSEKYALGCWIKAEGRLDAYILNSLDRSDSKEQASSQDADLEIPDPPTYSIPEPSLKGDRCAQIKQQREIESFFIEARFLQYLVIQEDNDEEGAGEREVLLKVLPSCAIVECFVGAFQETGFTKLERWDRICCELELKEDKLERTKQQTKEFRQEDRVFGSNKTHLTGQIIYSNTRKENPDLLDYVIDCGFPVFILCDKGKTNLKPGDWVTASGRLDVFLHEVYPTRTKNLDESVERFSEPGEKDLEIRMEITEIDESFLCGRKNSKQ